MTVVAWQGVSYSSSESATVAWKNIGGSGPGSILTSSPIAPADYPFTDPVFQNFTAQQYVTLGTAGAAQTYSEVAPAIEKAPEHVETYDERKVRLNKELAGLKAKDKLTAKDKARMAVVEAAVKNGHKE